MAAVRQGDPLLSRCAVAILTLLVFSAAAQALQPDQIALIVNDKAPGSRELAEFYAQQRHIPDGRIITISFDQRGDVRPTEEIGISEYESTIATPVREFLTKNGLKDRVTCLVSFWGVPLRIAARQVADDDRKELADIDKQRTDVQTRLEAAVGELEGIAAKVHPGFVPTTQPAGQNPAISFEHRANLASVAAVAGLFDQPANAQRAVMVDRLVQLATLIGGRPRSIENQAKNPISRLIATPVTPEQLAGAEQDLADTKRRLAPLGMDTPISRAALRQITRDNLGVISELDVLGREVTYLRSDPAPCATDSALATAWWGSYPRYRRLPNPLSFRNAGLRLPGSTLMVVRIDAPTLAVARSLITTGIDVEKKGLSGQVAIDARGLPLGDDFGLYDQRMRFTAEYLRKTTRLNVIVDNHEAVFPKGSLNDVAFYWGWHSLRTYVSPGRFSPGAVALHIASYELVGLHAPGETGWVAGLLNDGVVATSGPVAEPYLDSFPRPDDFVPLLLTGRLTMAEVYWKTLPNVGWMQDYVGDPLYRPCGVNPPLRVEDLPQALREALPK
jgi:uncharacterized protein (TIGR03790 family)